MIVTTNDHEIVLRVVVGGLVAQLVFQLFLLLVAAVDQAFARPHSRSHIACQNILGLFPKAASLMHHRHPFWLCLEPFHRSFLLPPCLLSLPIALHPPHVLPHLEIIPRRLLQRPPEPLLIERVL